MSQAADRAVRIEEPITGVPLRTIRHQYSITARPLLNFPTNRPPRLLEIDGQTVVLDGTKIRNPRSGDYFLSWGSSQFHARLQISKDRLWCEGIIGLHATPGAEPELYMVTGVAEPQSVQLADGRSLTVGYQVRPDDTGLVDLRCQLDGVDLTGEVKSALDPSGTLRLSAPALPTPLLVDATGVKSSRSSEMTESFALAEDEPAGNVALTLASLISQNTEGIGDQTQNLLKGNLAWALEPKWGNAFFTVPNLSQDPVRMNVIDQDCEWYNCCFAPAYLGYGVSQMTRENPKYTLTQQYVDRLQYYLCEDIGEDIVYTRQTKALTVLAALATTAGNTPNLADYANDTSNPPGYWAQTLYDQYLNTEPHYAALTVGVPDANGNFVAQNLQNAMQLLNNYATILTVLDTTGQYAQQYYQSAYAAIAAAFMPNAQLPSDIGAYQEWLGDWIQAFIDAFQASPTQPADLTAAAAWSIGQDFNAVVQMGQTVDQVATAFAQLGVACNTNGLLSTTATQAYTNLQTQYPKLTRVGKYFMLTTIAALWMQSTSGIGNFSSLSAPDLTTAINNLVGLTAGLLAAVPDIINVASWIGTNAQALAQAFKLFFLTPSGIRSIIGLQGTVANAVQAFTWMRTALQPAGGFNAQGTVFGRVFNFANKMLGWIGVGVAVVAAGVSIWTLVLDVQAGASTTTIAFDIANAAFSFAVAAAAFAAITCESVIPAVIGALAALGGLVVWFVSSLFATPPPSPPDEYLQNVAAPYAAGLPDPPPGWQAPSMKSTGANKTTRPIAGFPAAAIAIA